MSNFRWFICGMLFLATMINYMDRQVLSLTWKDFIAPQYAWDDDDYGNITAIFSLVYACSMLAAGRLIDVIGAKKGYILAMCIWCFGAMLHGFCGLLTAGVLTGVWSLDIFNSVEILHDYGVAGLSITTMSIWMFMACRCVLAFGESGNFPAAIKVTTAFFPKKDRAFAISVFNNGACVGALIAPITIPTLASHFGWEMAFIVVGAIGYLWVLIWIMAYCPPHSNEHLNMAELNYILQDEDIIDEKQEDSLEKMAAKSKKEKKEEHRMSVLQCFRYKHTWALITGKFLTDGAWWFYLFWTPVYLSEFYGYTSDSPMGMAMIFVMYLISMLSVMGGYLPVIFVNRFAIDPYEGRKRAMLLFAAIQLTGMLAIPLGSISPWLLVVIIGLQAASHQSWSANLYAMVGDFFPKNIIATVTGIAGFAGGISSFFVMKYLGTLLKYADNTDSAFTFMGYDGKAAAYMLVFSILSVSYIVGWGAMRAIAGNEKTAKTEVK